jgi:hypothetical protein
MNLTKKRLLLLLSALAAEETSLIDDEAWHDQYPSEKAALDEINATRAWIINQLNKRGA